MTAANPSSRDLAGYLMEPAQSAWVRDLRLAVPCRAHRSTDGGPCQNFAVKGSSTCHAHGSMAPQARRAAQRRLAGAATEALAARACARLGVWPQATARAWAARALAGLGAGP
jgi:hypothetical protein